MYWRCRAGYCVWGKSYTKWNWSRNQRS